MPFDIPIRRAAAVLTVLLIVIATCVIYVICNNPRMSTITESDIPGVYIARSELERETSPNVPLEDLTALVQGNNDFAFNLYQKIRDASGNMFFSPYSISSALVMAYAGARGETEQQMADALHFSLPQDRLHSAFNALDLTLVGEESENFKLNIANSSWGQFGYPFRSEYLDILAKNYGAGMWLVDFMRDPEGARLKINDWVSDKTENKIENILPPGSIYEYTRLVLANAIYFNAQWRFLFPESQTENGKFTLLDGGQVDVEMMSQAETFRYAAGEGYQVVELPYVNQDVSMLIILPTLENFGEFERTLDAGRVGEMVQNLESKYVALKMPKFGFEASLSLNDKLSEMRMTAAFNPQEADFSGITGDRSLHIDAVLHKAFISVKENGTEAAAATVVVVGTTGIPPEPSVEVSIDHPFIFMIRHNNTGSILFLGRVLDPTA